MLQCSVVTLSRFPKILEGFMFGVEDDEPDCPIHVIMDTDPPDDFCIAKNANKGWREVGADRDIIYAGDDTRIIEGNTIRRLQTVAHADPRLGILSARIVGQAQPWQMNPPKSPITYASWIAFVFVFIKREVINKIGYLDETFEGYGFEDIDYCYRALKAGFTIGATPLVSVSHGVEGHTWGSTFQQVKTQDQLDLENSANRKRFADKWRLPNDPGSIFRALDAVSTAKRR